MAEETKEMNDGLVEIQSYGVKMPDGKTKVFTDKADALSQVTRNQVEAKVRDYTTARGLTDKVANTRINVIVDYLSWIDQGMPGPKLAETPEEPVSDGAGADTEGYVEE